jgi:hypothetical protein
MGLALIVLYSLSFTFLIDKRPFVEWTLIKGSPEETAAEAQLIKMPDGQVMLLNSGEASGSLNSYLKKQKVRDLDLVILGSLAQRDILGIQSLLSAGVRIREVRFNPSFQKSQGWQETQLQLQRKGVVVKEFSKTESFFNTKETQFRVLGYGKNYSVLRLNHGVNHLLVTLGEAPLADQDLFNLSCDFLKNDIFLDYFDYGKSEKKLRWPSCFQVASDLSQKAGTFKILLKGDSFKWKQGR